MLICLHLKDGRWRNCPWCQPNCGGEDSNCNRKKTWHRERNVCSVPATQSSFHQRTYLPCSAQWAEYVHGWLHALDTRGLTLYCSQCVSMGLWPHPLPQKWVWPSEICVIMGLWFQGHLSPTYTASQEAGYARLEVYVTSQAYHPRCSSCRLQPWLATFTCGKFADISLSGDCPEP